MVALAVLRSISQLGALKVGLSPHFILHLFDLIPSCSSIAKMDHKMNESDSPGEKHAGDAGLFADPEGANFPVAGENVLHRDLKGRHMQMIAM